MSIYMASHMKTAIVIGSSGFIATNLVKRLKEEGWFVRGIDLRMPQYGIEPNEFQLMDASEGVVIDKYYDRVYELAAEMGGAGYIFTGENDANIMTNSASINLNILPQALEHKCGAIFYSSSVCVYPDGVEGKESDAWTGHPPSSYGVEKLFSEGLYLAHAKNYGLNVKIARFHNTFGPYGTYKGGREKAPAAICRKIAESDGVIEVWGDGEQVRPFIYIEDLLDGIEALMQSDITGPVNLGPSDKDGITINRLIEIVSGIAEKDVEIKYIDGPTGELVRHANNDMARGKLGWEPKRDLVASLKETYDWINSQICE